jgi:hypothetical protein
VAQGSVTLTNDTLSGNHATGGNGGTANTDSGGGGGAGSGGGLYVAQGSVTLTNDTFSSNQASGGNGGTAGNAHPGGPGGNGGNGEGGGLYLNNSNSTTLANSLIAQNTVTAGTGGSGTPAGSAGSTSGPDVSGTAVSSDHDLIGNSSGYSATASNGDILDPATVGLDPMGLQDHGGPTQTIALLSGPAIDAGDSHAPGLSSTDQRGFARIVGSAVDIGAYESASMAASTDVSVSISPVSSVAFGGQITYTLTVTNNSTTASSSNITLVDAVPANTTLVSWHPQSGWQSSAPPLSSASGTVSAWISSLAANTSATFTLVVQLSSSATVGSVISDTASVGPTTGDANLNNNSQSVQTTVTQATPTVTVTDGGTYNGNPENAVGSAVGVDGKTAVAGSFSYTYYASDGTTVLSGAPTNAASYYVVAAFTSSDPNYTNASSAQTAFTISPALPTVTVSDGGTYNGNPYIAVGSAVGVDGKTAVAGTFSYTYYASDGTTVLSGAPTNAGNYYVTAAFTSSGSNYTNANSAKTSFTIGAAKPTVSVTDGGIYNGKPFPATGSAVGVDGVTSVAGSFTYAYYTGSSATGASSATAPTNAGTYTVVATFTSSDPNYTGGSAQTTFTIGAAKPTVSVTDGGIYNGKPFPATGSAVGVDGVTSVAGIFSYAYYTGSSASGTPLAAAPTNAGTYTVVATFTSSDPNYTGGSAQTTFTISTATLSASGANFSATAGAPFTGTVATISNNVDPLGSAAYTAVISWGDGSTSSGVISGTGSTLTVTGSHTFADPVNKAVSVTITNNQGNTTTATVSDTATVTSLGLNVAKDMTGGIGFWHNTNGQALINSFNGGSTSTALGNWLAANFPNLYGASAGTNNLTGQSNAQVATYFQKLFNLGGNQVQAQTLAVALNVYATTSSLGGNAGVPYGFTVSATGLGARLYNVGKDGAAFGVANNTTLNVYELLVAVNRKAVNGVLYNGDATLQAQCADLFNSLDQAGSIPS